MTETQIEVKVNQKLNRLYVKLRGAANDQNTQDVLRHLNMALKRLRPGFTVLSDISEMNRLSPSYFIIARKVMKSIKDAKPGKIARVVNPIIGIQMNRVGKLVGSTGINFKTVEEASDYLDK